MSSKTTYLQLNSGKNITISSVYIDSDLVGNASRLPDGDRGWCYDKGTTNGSTPPLDLTGLYDEALSRPSVSITDYQLVTSPHTAEEMTSAAFIQALYNLNSGIAWLWGNINDGGYGFIHYDGYIKAIQFNGVTKDTDNIYRYRLSFGTITGNDPSLTRTWLSNCVICQTEISETVESDIIVFMSNPNDITTYYMTLAYDDILQGMTWTPTYDHIAGSYTANAAWDRFGINSEYPVMPWYVGCYYVRSNGSNCAFADLVTKGLYAGQETDEEGNPYYEGGTTGEDGGGGSFDGSSESSPRSDTSEITTDAINSGFVTLYNPTKSEMQSFNDWLWTSITDALSTQIKRLITNPLEAIIFIAETHLTPPASNLASEIKFCGIGSGVNAYKVTKQFSTFDCGTLQVKDADNNTANKIEGDTASFLDYQPYSKCEIYLPCIGFKELDINDVIKSTLSLSYQVDWLSGSCLAQISAVRNKRCNGDGTLNDNTLYEFQGNIYTILPLSATDWKSFYSNVLGAVGGLASMLSGSPQGIAGGVANIANSVLSQQVSVQKSGSVHSSYGFMGLQDVKVYLTRPNVAIPNHFGGFNGYTSNIYFKLSDLEGYTELDTDAFWSDNFDGITEDESNLLKNICASGIYL